MNKWLIISACISGIVAGAWYQSGDRRDYNELAAYETLVQSFSRVVFENDFRPSGVKPTLDKWAGPVRLRILGNHEKWHRDHIAEQVKIYEQLTGLSFSFNDLNANMEVLFSGNDDEVSKWALSNEITADGVSTMLSAACSFVTFGYFDGPITAAFISIRLYPKKNWSGHCLIEETAQALGLPADKALYRPTIFGRDDKPEKLSVNDKLLIRALYDDRLGPNMTRAEAMPIVRELIRELHDAVKQHGEEALYQR